MSSASPPTEDPDAFRKALNARLPRKRAIAQLLVRDEEGRVLTCRLTYKPDWDLPGGVVEVGESPRLAAAREVAEELGIAVTAGALLLVDWLPPWAGWDDAVCLVFDGGVMPSAALDGAVLEPREIRSAQFAAADDIAAHCRDFTARRIAAARAALAGEGPAYVESGR